MFRTPGRVRSLVVMLTAAFVLSLMSAASVVAQRPEDRGKPDRVITASDVGKRKLHPRLAEQVESGSTDSIYVFATVVGDPAGALTLLDNANAARADGGALVVGQIPTQQLPKLASMANVVSVGPIDLKKTGEPLGVPDPELNQRPSLSTLQSFLNNLRRQEVPYEDAPPPKTSNFEDLKELAILDAKTHNFVEAWEMGYTGEGVTVGVLDGGTDFGHPDLIGTWQTWPDPLSPTGSRDSRWAGWPMAFDPYGTLVWLVAPSFVDAGLTWYTFTEEKTDFTQRPIDALNDLYRVTFATKTGPARNFSAPDGTREHQYTFPTDWAPGAIVRMGSHPDDHLLQLFSERPAFLVTDQDDDGLFETVYVDLDNDYQFADEKPITKASPVSYRDMNGDGYTDLSGGLLYYISDGLTSIPGGLTTFTGVAGSPKPEPGALLAWTGDYDPAIGGHGTLTASNVVGQGVINGKAPCFADLADADGAVPCPGGGTYPGAVIGGAPDARLAPFGDIYFSFEFSTQLGYFLSNLRGVNVTSNSYGSSDQDNDGYDAASQEADVIHTLFGRRTTPLFSTGNGAPGFGTTAPPTPVVGIGVGASTQFGGTGWDSIANASQIVDNEVMVWSNRGPGATGSTGVDVVADGAFSAGDLTLNTVLSGNNAWESWGGTSRSAPVAAGATALIYQAWIAAHGAPPAGFAFTAQEILQASAKDLGYESWIQGSGSVDAGMAVKVASGTAGYVSPAEWRAGDYRGTEYAVFTHIMAPGDSDTQSFEINGSGTFEIADRYLVATGGAAQSFTSSRVNKESPYNFNAPDYLIDITELVEKHASADLMVVRLNYPYASFDPNGNYVSDNEFRLLTYSWTDINGNGRLWTDRDRDGAVDHAQTGTSSNIDGFLDLNFARSEIEKGEYVRFMYHRAGANTLQNFVRNPADAMGDGIFLGLQHFKRTGAVPTTTFDIQIDFYENVDWPWLSAPASASGSFDATLSAPSDAPYGMYDGAIVLSKDDEEIVVPVTVTVAPTLEADAEGNLPQETFGGTDVAAAQGNLPYNNGAVFGASDWTWRPESGDWRFFYFDVDADVGEGTLFLTDTSWDGMAPHTDLDTLIFGPSENHFQLLADTVFGAPYILDTVGKSPNTNTDGGVWIFNTATGEARDVVAGPAQAGLHALLQHQVLHEGDQFWTPFGTTLGTATVSPSEVEVDAPADSGSFEITFRSNLDLDGLEAEGFGLSQPSVLTRTAQQDDPSDPSSASVKEDVAISHASTARFATELAGHDIDLFVVYDANNDGQFTNSEIVGASTTPTGDEFVELVRPPDGDYQVWVQGWSVSGTPEFTLTIDVVQGNDLTISGLPEGAIPAGTEVTLTVEFSKTMMVGESYFGEIVMGPTVAPTALRIPVTINRVASP